METVTRALFVRLRPKAGKELEVENFLKSALPLVEAEPKTLAWFAVRLDDGSFAIFDAFPDQGGREDHLNGKVAEALMKNAPDLLAEAPVIEKADVLAAKLP